MKFEILRAGEWIPVWNAWTERKDWAGLIASWAATAPLRMLVDGVAVREFHPTK